MNKVVSSSIIKDKWKQLNHYVILSKNSHEELIRFFHASYKQPLINLFVPSMNNADVNNGSAFYRKLLNSF